MNLRTEVLKGDHKAIRLAVMIMDTAGMIRVPDDAVIEEKELSEEAAMLQEHVAAIIHGQATEAGTHE